ncbi:hypothetical protein BMJ35_23180 [Sinorhizobium medicae]|nr:hypothetical protein BMJ35_23180 [Sinorhizobium medicae]
MSWSVFIACTGVVLWMAALTLVVPKGLSAFTSSRGAQRRSRSSSSRSGPATLNRMRLFASLMTTA